MVKLFSRFIHDDSWTLLITTNIGENDEFKKNASPKNSNRGFET